MMQIESFKAPFVVRVLKWHCGSRSCQQGRNEGMERLPEEGEQVKSAQRALKRILPAKWSEWTTDGRTRGLERGNGCKSDLEKLAPRRSLKYIKVKSSVVSDIGIQSSVRKLRF